MSESRIEYLSPQEYNAYKCCGVVALLNALRYFGKDTMDLEGPAWRGLVREAGCRGRPCLETRIDDIAGDLGIVRNIIPRTLEAVRENLPVMVPLCTTTAPYHIALAIGVEEDIVEMANYGGYMYYDVVSHRCWEKIRFVSEDIANTYAVRLA